MASKFRVRNKDGELTVGSFAELRTLYQRQFISAEDEVMREGTGCWRKAGAMPELRTAKPNPYLQGNEFAWLAILIAVGTLVLILVMQQR